MSPPDELSPPPPFGVPAAEYDIDEALVRALLADQHPDLAGLPLRAIGRGWDNAMFRLGDDLAVRMPRRQLAAPLILNEQAWLPVLAKDLEVPVPMPARIGVPALGYPWHWSVVPWLPGAPAGEDELNDTQAARFGAFLRALHLSAPPGAPINQYRGGPLGDRAAATEERIVRLEQTSFITPSLRDLWNVALSAPIDLSPTWIHGDLHPHNVLTESGTITGVIDWGDMASGDPATDLASLWMLFDPAARAGALGAYGGVSEATAARAKGWAFLLGVMLLAAGLVDSPGHAKLGERILIRLERETR